MLIKLPADVCQQGDWGAKDEPACLSGAAQQQLEQDLDNYVQSGKVKPGGDNIAKRPGSYVVFVREYGTVWDLDVGDFGVNWSREFFCINWVSPNKKYKIINSDNTCYIDFASPAPDPTTTPAPTTAAPTPEPTPEPSPEPTPEPTPAPAPAPAPEPMPEPTPAPLPPPSQSGIKNHEEVCLQAVDPPFSGSRVTVAECNGSQEQDWTFGNDAITYGNFCLEALDAAADGSSLILNDCQGSDSDRQHFEGVETDQSWIALSVGVGHTPQRCLDVWTDSSSNAKGLWIWECNEHANQKWQLPQAMWATV